MTTKKRELILTTHSGVCSMKIDLGTCDFSVWEALMHELGVELVSRETQASNERCKILVMELMSEFIKGTGIDSR